MQTITVSLEIYVETATEAPRGSPTRADAPEYQGETEARFAFLDNDRALSADSGYSGWVQLPDGTLYVVNYIADDAHA